MTETRERDREIAVAAREIAREFSRNTPAVLTAEEAAAYLNVSEPQLKAWRIKGEGPPVRRYTKGRSARARYWRKDLDAWLASLPADPALPNSGARRKGGIR